MKNKTKAAPTAKACTSKNNGQTCALRGEHTIHSTTAEVKKVSQHRTWELVDGKVSVTTFNRGKKMSSWFEEAPPALGRIEDGTAPVAIPPEEIERCDAKRFGCTRCLLRSGHAGDHFTIGNDSGRASSWVGLSDEMNSWFPCNVGNDGTICSRPEEHDGHHRGLGRDGKLHEWDEGGPVVVTFQVKDLVAQLLGHGDPCDTVFAAPKNPDPSLADACPKCGFELGQHTGKKCPKAVKPARQKHVEPEVSVEIGHASLTVSVDDGPIVVWESFSIGQRVQLAKRQRGPVETGTVRELVDTQRGKRALVAWADGEQFVDLVELVVAPTASAASVKFTDLCLKCGLAKHAGKCATAKASTPAYIAPDQEQLICGYPRHPAAALFDLLEGAALTALADSIEKNGQRDPIVRVTVGEKTYILDGSNRGLACEMRKIEPKFVDYEGPTDTASLVAYSIDKNKHRRHLEPSQLAMIASDAAQLGQGNPGDRETGRPNGLMTQAEAGAALGVSETLVRRAKVVQTKGTAKVNQAVRKGKLAVDAAVDLVRLSPPEQDKIADEALAKKDGRSVRSGRVRSLVKQQEKRQTVRKINEGRVMPMPLGPFGVIYGDYPWLFENSDQHEGSRGHMGYPPMTIDEIIAHARDTRSRAAENCVLALWVPNWHIVEQMKVVIEAYGAVHRTVWTWPKPHFGVGTWGRGQTEHLVIAEIGTTVHTLNEVSTLLPPYPLREHSRKPDEVAELLLKHCSGPHLELFGREPRDGYAVWGAEPKKFAAEAA